MSKGVLYIASGESYIEEAKISAESLKRHNPSLPITLYTDSKNSAPVFDNVINIDSSVENWGDSILSRINFPYDKNLYLDADTYICGDIMELFDVLENTDLCIAHDASRGRYNSDMYANIEYDLPDTFPEYNTGVMCYNNNKKIKQLFDDWNEKYYDFGFNRNQPAFRIALYENDLQYATIPPEYNFRFDRVGYACGEVKILHKCSADAGRRELAAYAERVNSNHGKRVITWDDYPCRVVLDSSISNQYKLKSLKKQANQRVQNDGFIPLVESAIGMSSNLVKSE